jgi:hypothetical protein
MHEKQVTMYVPSSYETHNDNDTCIKTTISIDQQAHVQKVDCAIIGAGAAGLQCAAILLKRQKSSVLSSSSLSSSLPNSKNDEAPENSITSDCNKEDKTSLVVLEARNRTGGRILTTHEKTVTVGPGGSVDPAAEVLLYRDHGAAWVHGAHESNPMIQLLIEESDSHSYSPSTTTQTAKVTTTDDQPLRVLNPVFEGNPWIRPDTILHQNGKKGGNSLISFFVNGSFVPNNDDENDTACEEIDKRDEIIQEGVGNDQSVAPTSSRSSLFSLAIERHYRVLHEIASKFNSDEYEYDDHENVDELYKQLISDLPTLTENEEDEDEKRLVSLLTPFYLFLMENWNGISMKETGLEQVLEFLMPDEDVYSEEEMKEHKKDIAMPETDEQYICAGDFIGPHCKVKTGMSTVLEPLIRVLERHHQHEGNNVLCLGEEVVSIMDKKSHVRIEMTSGNIIEAKCCVSTIPLGCLQHSISMQTESKTSATTASKSFFQPRLCNDKIEAINSIWSGSYKKVFLTFDHIFWPKETPIIGLVRSEPVEYHPEGSLLDFPGQYLLLYNLWARDKNIPSIEAILCGDLGKWAFEKSDTIIKQAVINFIEAAMGLSDLLTSCIGCHVTRWEEDEFTRGSYSTYQLGTLDRHVDALRSPEWDGRLVFAGEATENDHMGSVHAALISGKRASKQVLDFLSVSNTTSK